MNCMSAMFVYKSKTPLPCFFPHFMLCLLQAIQFSCLSPIYPIVHHTNPFKLPLITLSQLSQLSHSSQIEAATTIFLISHKI